MTESLLQKLNNLLHTINELKLAKSAFNDNLLHMLSNEQLEPIREELIKLLDSKINELTKEFEALLWKSY